LFHGPRAAWQAGPKRTVPPPPALRPLSGQRYYQCHHIPQLVPVLVQLRALVPACARLQVLCRGGPGNSLSLGQD
jgi:hypothetical protein